jgi:uncharacterized Zn-finger protein
MLFYHLYSWVKLLHIRTKKLKNFSEFRSIISRIPTVDLKFLNNLFSSGTRLKLKCKVCKMEFTDEHHLENHKKVHGKKISEYGDPEFSKDRLRG